MTNSGQLVLKFKAFSQLGIMASLNYLIYQIGLYSGFYTLSTPIGGSKHLLEEELKPNWFWRLPDPQKLLELHQDGIDRVLLEANEIRQKKYRYFGGQLKTLALNPEKDKQHWCLYERKSVPIHCKDIKYVWEPARFDWGIQLGKAFYLRQDESYALAFWRFFEEFIQANPTNCGLNWTSAQEIGLRLINLILCSHLLRTSEHSSPQRMAALYRTVADHAARIPLTVNYALAQNNNHLISEAVALFTAGIFLPNHPKAGAWCRQGWHWFNQALINQIEDNGSYIQHSSNYHRMMLMLSLWMKVMADEKHLDMEEKTLEKLAAAAKWLIARLDLSSGQVPNLGHNDGTYVFPLSFCSYSDYRPVAQAAARVFLGRPALEIGKWDDLCLWLGIPIARTSERPLVPVKDGSDLILGDQQNWAALRAAHFSARPAHADQLHVEIWSHGINIAMDAGTYQYNAPPPWENSLSTTLVHNTITVNGQDQMVRAGKFLWLDWSQAQIIEISPDCVTASHNGYQRLGVIHRRTLKKISADGWGILDELLPVDHASPEIQANLNWLLPDWPFEINKNRIELQSPIGLIQLSFEQDIDFQEQNLDIYREGKSLLTGNEKVSLGWYSPTYGIKKPALSVQYAVCRKIHFQIRSTFFLPGINY